MLTFDLFLMSLPPLPVGLSTALHSSLLLPLFMIPSVRQDKSSRKQVQEEDVRYAEQKRKETVLLHLVGYVLRRLCHTR
jgi:hypothetical protein